MEKTNKPTTEHDSLVRIGGSDLSGRKGVLVGLTKIKGISWSCGNALCKLLKISPRKKISELDRKEIDEIEEFIVHPKLPKFLMNRRKDLDSGEDMHLNGGDLKLRQEFDIKRLKKIKSYRGARHASNLPSRGQRTKSNFRRHRKKSSAKMVKEKK
jgi:small subunit ribosomal protein S13